MTAMETGPEMMKNVPKHGVSTETTEQVRSNPCGHARKRNQ